MPVHVTSLLCLLSEAHRGEGLDIPSPLLGCHLWQTFRCLRVARDVRFGLGSGCFSIVRIARSTVDTVHSSVVGGFWLLFHTSQCEGGPRILRSILGHTKSMPVAIPQVQFLVKVIRPLLSCVVPLVKQRRKLDFPQLPFAVFLRPFVSGRHLFGVRLWSTRLWTFLEDDFRKVSVFITAWFDSGYMFRQFMEAFLVSTIVSCCGAEADFHGLAVQQTIVLPLLQYIDKVIDVLCRSSWLCVQLWDTVEIPQLRPFLPCTRSLTCPLCSTTYALGRIRAWTRSSSSLSWRSCRFPWSFYHGDFPVAVH